MSVLVNDSGSVRVGCKSPDEVSGLFANFDTSLQTGYVDGNLVSSWTDLIAGNNLVQANSSKQLTYKTNQQNGYPAFKSINVFPDADNNFLVGSNSTLEALWSGDITFFIVVFVPNTITAPVRLLSSGSFGNATKGFDLLIRPEGVFYEELSTGGVVWATPTRTINFGAINLICVNIKRSGASYIRTLNTPRTLVNSATPAYQLSTTSNLFLGISHNLASAPMPINTRYNQLCIYNRSLAKDEDGAVFRGLKFKWGA